ncbi:conserved hypothetical protein [Streptococcus agalactiae 515]|nr:conserved hypothetical protein [Streptococcus agalactiae 515]
MSKLTLSIALTSLAFPLLKVKETFLTSTNFFRFSVIRLSSLQSRSIFPNVFGSVMEEAP